MTAERFASAATARPPTALELLLLLAQPEDLDAVRERLKLTPEKLRLRLIRILNPDEILEEREECVLRGVSDKTLKGMKDRGELPTKINGDAKG